MAPPEREVSLMQKIMAQQIALNDQVSALIKQNLSFNERLIQQQTGRMLYKEPTIFLSFSVSPDTVFFTSSRPLTLHALTFGGNDAPLLAVVFTVTFPNLIVLTPWRSTQFEHSYLRKNFGKVGIGLPAGTTLEFSRSGRISINLSEGLPLKETRI